MKNTYARMNPVAIAARQWPARTIERSPLWCAVDLRDGNQALPNPMTPEQKLAYFKLLVQIGFKEIEVGFPSASEDDFSFTRRLIEENLIPDDVTISVLVQSREHLIKRTVESLRGVKRAVIHAYIATSDLHTEHVFGMNRESVVSTAIEAVKLIRSETERVIGKGVIGLEFSPEEFTDTDQDFALRICEAVFEAWAPYEDEKIIFNLPMTVERRLPNEYADMIEDFLNRFRYRNRSIVSLHAHNDMGCAVAASMMALMAGADRVEGTLLGHGERTGNLDLITMALDLEYLGIDTGLDFSNLPDIVATVEDVTGIPVHARHPYSGELVFTAFSGSHQDAINKGFVKKEQLAERFGGWKIPYLHVDPSSLGRKFEKFIRINSQSGKGGIAFILKQDYNINVPKWAQADFAASVQSYADKAARELDSAEVMQIFLDTYIDQKARIALAAYWPRPTETDPSMIEAEVAITVEGSERRGKAAGNGPISALVAAMAGIDGVGPFVLEGYEEETLGKGADAKGICFVSLRREGAAHASVGAGIDSNIIQAAAKAVVSALNRM